MIGKPPTRYRGQAVKHAPDVIRGVPFRPLTRYKGSEKPHLENRINALISRVHARLRKMQQIYIEKSSCHSGTGALVAGVNGKHQTALSTLPERKQRVQA